MNNEKIISSLKVKKLFGEYDIDIDFNEITVLVGKNGLGKTTLLKIIQGMMTGNYHLNYSEICDTIELTLPDGHTISYGMLNPGVFLKPEVKERLLLDGEVFEKISSAIETKPEHTLEEKNELIREYLELFLSSNSFYEKAQEYLEKNQSEMRNKVFVDKKYRNEILNSIEIRYISTVNISANADKDFDAGNSIKINLLDVAIEAEIRNLLKKKDTNLTKKFKNQVDFFLKESGKSISFEGEDLVFSGKKNKKLRLSLLSSGERQLVYILATAANTHGKPALFLMDEPEVSLHLSWQEKIIDAIVALNDQMQIIAVTHSPGIIMHGHMDAYVEMKDIMQEIKNA